MAFGQAVKNKTKPHPNEDKRYIFYYWLRKLRIISLWDANKSLRIS